MKHEVFWKNPSYKPRSSLNENIECDCLIVGGGVTGISLAYFLHKFGAKKIVLIEKDLIGSGATGKSAGQLSTRGENDIGHFANRFGRKEAIVLFGEIHKAVKEIGELIKKEKVKCQAEFVDTLYVSFKNKNNFNDVEKEFDLESEIDVNTMLLSGLALEKEINSKIFDSGILSKNHGVSVNPLMFPQNFSVVLEKKGVKIYENTAFLKMEKNVAMVPHGKIKFKKIFFATDSGNPSTKVKKMKTTIAITNRLSKRELKKMGFTKNKMVWDSRERYDYFKLTKDKRIMIGTGGFFVHKKHAKSIPAHPPHVSQIKKSLERMFPYINFKIEYSWSGSYGVTENWMPFIESKKDRYSISGCGDQVFCFMSAKHIVLKMLGKKSPLDKFFKVQ